MKGTLIYKHLRFNLDFSKETAVPRKATKKIILNMQIEATDRRAIRNHNYVLLRPRSNVALFMRRT